MRQLSRLQDAINERYSRLADTDAQILDHQVALTRDWVNAQPELRAILAEAQQAEPGLDFEAWYASLSGSQEFVWPSRTEAGRAWLVWQLMNRVAAGDARGDTYQIVRYSNPFKALPPKLGVRDQNNDAVKGFAKQVFRPFFDYLSDQVGFGSAVVHVLQRYVARVEWYDREHLHRRYRVAVRAGRVGEDVYDRDLQRFLFLDAGYITQAKARSASGEADMIGSLDTDDPLVCEGKLYVEDGRGKAHLAKGFHQVIKYAHDYNKTVAYLVVFNLTEKLLEFPSDGPAGEWARFIEHANVRVHPTVVRALPPCSTASKAGKAKTVRISREDLVDFVDQEDDGE